MGRALPYRTAAPPPPEEPEAEHPYAIKLRVQRRRARIGFAAAVVLTGSLFMLARSIVTRGHVETHGRELAATRALAAHRAIDAAHGRAQAEQAAFERGMRVAIGADVSPGIEPCPIAVSPPRSAILHGLGERSVSFPMLTLTRVEIGTSMFSPTVAGVLADVHRAEAHLQAGRHEEARLYADALTARGRFVWDIVLVARRLDRPKAVSETGYAPGTVEGRVYLYDFASGRVVCTGDVHAESSAQVGFAYATKQDAPPWLEKSASLTATLEDDLRVQTEKAIAESLRRPATN